jgi:hypothetical protein
VDRSAELVRREGIALHLPMQPSQHGSASATARSKYSLHGPKALKSMLP